MLPAHLLPPESGGCAAAWSVHCLTVDERYPRGLQGFRQRLLVRLAYGPKNPRTAADKLLPLGERPRSACAVGGLRPMTDSRLGASPWLLMCPGFVDRSLGDAAAIALSFVRANADWLAERYSFRIDPRK